MHICLCIPTFISLSIEECVRGKCKRWYMKSIIYFIISYMQIIIKLLLYNNNAKWFGKIIILILFFEWQEWQGCLFMFVTICSGQTICNAILVKQIIYLIIMPLNLYNDDYILYQIEFRLKYNLTEICWMV